MAGIALNHCPAGCAPSPIGPIVASALADLVERSPEPVAAARTYLHAMKAAAA